MAERIEDRYHHDPMFHDLVERLVVLLETTGARVVDIHEALPLAMALHRGFALGARFREALEARKAVP